MTNNCISFIVAVNNRGVLNANMLSSPIFNNNDSFDIIIQEGYKSAAKAYNNAINKSKNDLLVFVHQDVYFPGKWVDDLFRAVSYLDSKDPEWGVLGCIGASKDGTVVGNVYSSGLGTILGDKFDRPVQVQTLDEIVLIIKKSSGLRFDEDLPSFHLYGTDICMNAFFNNRQSYVIPAFCIHNSNKNMYYPPEYYKCVFHVIKRWRKYLPIYTTCMELKLANIFKSMINNYIKTYRYKGRRRNTRVNNPADIALKIGNDGML